MVTETVCLGARSKPGLQTPVGVAVSHGRLEVTREGRGTHRSRSLSVPWGASYLILPLRPSALPPLSTQPGKEEQAVEAPQVSACRAGN